MTEFLIVVLLVVIAGLLYYRQRKAQQHSESAKPERRVASSDSRYHAVSIRFDANACAAAKALAGSRFLAAEAPTLPLANCDAHSCQCRFVHHHDRRSGKDRRSPFAAGGVPGGTGKFDTERRTGNDRRHDADHNDLDFTI